jgi:membrane protease YdiL (CAAX protease family)
MILSRRTSIIEVLCLTRKVTNVMDFTGLVLIGGVLSYVGIMVYSANQIEAQPETGGWFTNPTLLRWLLLGLVGMMFILGLTVMQAALFGDIAAQMPEAEQVPLPEISVVGGGITFLVTLAASIASYFVITSDVMRQRLQFWLNRWGGTYNANSAVHTTAFVLMLAVIIWTVVNFVLQGGVEGIAQDIQTNGVEAGDVIFQAVVEIVITLLGVGFAIRRGVPETLARLGLRIPTRQDVIWGVGVGLGLLIFMLIFNVIWTLVTSPELIEQQTSAAEQLNMAFSTLPLAFVLAISASLGEEIWVRGGLQPIFGLGVSSIFFASLHMQVAFTPGIVLILIVSLGLGWLRRRHSTTAAIIAHFCFNFVQLALLALAVEAV